MAVLPFQRVLSLSHGESGTQRVGSWMCLQTGRKVPWQSSIALPCLCTQRPSVPSVQYLCTPACLSALRTTACPALRAHLVSHRYSAARPATSSMSACGVKRAAHSVRVGCSASLACRQAHNKTPRKA